MPNSQNHESLSAEVSATTAFFPDSASPRLVEAMKEYLARLEDGKPVNRREFLERYADIAADLEKCLGGLEFIQGAAPRFSEVGPVATPQSLEGESAFQPLGDYHIIREIARGGMGIVYEARQLSLRRRVALKVLPFAAALDPRALARFRQESLAAAQLDHPHIVPVYGVGSDRGVHYYAMRYIEGKSLAQVIAEMKGTAEPFSREAQPSEGNFGIGISDLGMKNDAQNPTVIPKSESRIPHSSNPKSEIPNPKSPLNPKSASSDIALGCASRLNAGAETVAFKKLPLSTDRHSNRPEYYRGIARLGIQAAEALDYAHSNGILHRDVKPGNLLVDGKGDVWITDFGLARIDTASNLTHTGDLMGTLRYMSPEQATAARGLVDQRSDVYSLGATLYELLTLHSVFTAEDRAVLLRQIAEDDPVPPRTIDRSIPEELETILLKCLEKEPSQRYATARATADDMQRFLEQKPISARRASPVELLRKWARRRKSILVVGAISMVIVGIAAAVGAVSRARAEAAMTARTTEKVQRALRDAAFFQGQAQPTDDLAKIGMALAAAEEADLFLAAGGITGGPLALQVKDRLRELRDEKLAADERARDAELDRMMLQSLQTIRLEQSESAGRSNGIQWDNTIAGEKYRDAFREYGIDVVRLAANGAAKQIRRSAIATELVTAIDCWALWQPLPAHPEQSALLLDITRAADPNNAWRNQLRRAAEDEPEKELPNLLELAQSADAPAQPVEYLTSISRRLAYLGAAHEALKLMKAAQRLRPDDFWVNHGLGYAYFRTINADTKIFNPQVNAQTAGTATLNAVAQQVRYFSIAVALNPRKASAHYNLGNALASAGAIDDAIGEFREAIQLDPRVAGGLANLGLALAMKGDLGAAVEALREYAQLYPDDAINRGNLGLALLNSARVDESIAEFRRAVELLPDDPSPYHNLAIALAKKGEFRSSLEAFRKLYELGRNNPHWKHRSAQLLNLAEQRVQFDERFPRLVAGDERPADAAEGVALAEFSAVHKHRPLVAAGWYRDAFAADPALAADLANGHRYNAACAVALAVTAVDPGELGDDERKIWREQALEWLTANLKAIELQSDNLQLNAKFAQTLTHWLKDSDLAGIRDADRLAALEGTEREGFEALWRDVKALLDKLTVPPPSSAAAGVK